MAVQFWEFQLFKRSVMPPCDHASIPSSSRLLVHTLRMRPKQVPSRIVASQFSIRAADHSIPPDFIVAGLVDNFIAPFPDIVFKVDRGYNFLQNEVPSLIGGQLIQLLHSVSSEVVVVPALHVGLEDVPSRIATIHVDDGLALLFGKGVELPTWDQTAEYLLSLRLTEILAYDLGFGHFGLDAFQIDQLHGNGRDTDNVAGCQLFATSAGALDVASVHSEVEARPEIGEVHQFVIQVIVPFRIDPTPLYQIAKLDSETANTFQYELTLNVFLLEEGGFDGADQEEEESGETSLLVEFVDSFNQKVDVVVGKVCVCLAWVAYLLAESKLLRGVRHPHAGKIVLDQLGKAIP